MAKKIKNKIVIGTWPLSGDYGIIKPSDVEKVLIKSFENGFKEFDTAPSYGNGYIENLLGSIFNKKKIKINTKIGNHPFTGKSFKLDDLKKSINNSLSRLKVENINILFLHNPRDELKPYLRETLSFLKNLKSKKIIKFTGLSCAPNYNYDNKFLKFFDFLQDDFNLLKKPNLREKNNIYARSVFANGILTGAIDRNQKFNKYDHRASWLNNNTRRSSIKIRLTVLRDNFGHDLKQYSFNYVLSNKKISKAIIGVKKREHIKNLELMINNFEKNLNTNNKIEKLIDNDFYLNQNHKELGF